MELIKTSHNQSRGSSADWWVLRLEMKPSLRSYRPQNNEIWSPIRDWPFQTLLNFLNGTLSAQAMALLYYCVNPRKISGIRLTSGKYRRYV
jgi:hypothetical protein